jgi:hypothetical protein
MKDYQKYLICAGVGALICFALILWFKPKTERPKPDSTPAIEISLLQDLSTFKSKEIVYKDSIKRLTASIERLKKTGIPTVNQNWLKESERVKRLSTDDKMFMLQDWYGWKDKIKKLVVSNDTIIGFAVYQFDDIGSTTVDDEYKSIVIDSLQGLCNYYSLNEEQYLKSIDNLNFKYANSEKRLALKDDLLKASNDNIEAIKKQAKKNGTRRFFQGLGLGAVGGFIGGLVILIF